MIKLVLYMIMVCSWLIQHVLELQTYLRCLSMIDAYMISFDVVLCQYLILNFFT
jgi:hypothetical protein